MAGRRGLPHAPGMWPALARTRRWILRVPEAPAETPTTSGAAPAVDAHASAEAVVLNLGRPEVDRLGAALQALLGPSTTRPDTPGRLEVALAAAVDRLGGDGRPQVTRRPAGLYTPEAWQVRLGAVDPAIAQAIRDAARGTGFRR